MNTIFINKVQTLDVQGEEAFKRLRTNLQFSGSEMRIIGLTSCIPNEGKSSISLNLAESLAQAGHKTLLIDADLRMSVLLGSLRVDRPVKGLTHYLSGLVLEEDIINQTNINNLDVIFSGPIPPNPSELLGGQNFEDLVKMLKESYDYIIIDTPPLGSVIDGAVVAKICNGMILVIRANTISYKFAKKVKRQLEVTGCTILGAVLNKADIEGKRGYFGYSERRVGFKERMVAFYWKIRGKNKKIIRK